MAAWGRGQEAVRSISTPREQRLQKPDLWTQLLSRQSAHHRVSSVVLEPSQDCATVGSRAFRHPASAVTPTPAQLPGAVTRAPSTGSRPAWMPPRASHTLWPWLLAPPRRAELPAPPSQLPWGSAPRTGCSTARTSHAPPSRPLLPCRCCGHAVPSGRRAFPSLLSTWSPSVLGFSGSGDLLGPCSQL